MTTHGKAGLVSSLLLLVFLLPTAAPAQIPGLPVTDVDPNDPGELRWYLNLDDILPFEASGAPRWSSKTIDSNLTLSAINSPYVICEGTLTVTDGATLTLPAGCEIYCGGGGAIYVDNGHIVASGASGDSVIISTIDEIDSNGILWWANTEPPYIPHFTVVGDSIAARGDWNRVELGQGSTATLDHTAIRYGSFGLITILYGSSSSATVTDCAFGMHTYDAMRHSCQDDTTTLIRYSEFNYSGLHGLRLDGNSARVHHCNFTGNDLDGMNADGIGAPTITNCGFYSNGDDGLGLAAAVYPIIEDCVFDGNSDYGLYFLNAADTAPPIVGCAFTNNYRPMQVPINLFPAKRQTEGDDNIYSPNEINVIRFIGRPLTGSDYTFPLEVKHKSDGRIPVTTYDVYKGAITIGSAYTLEVDAGVVFKGEESLPITVDGDLRINGTASEPCVFTALTDDAYGNTAYGEGGDSGDTNDDGTATTPEPGYWDGVGISGSGSSAVVRHAIFRYAIDGLTCANMDTIDVQHITADRNSDNGLAISGGLPATLRDIYLEANEGDGFYIAQNAAVVDSLTSRLSGANGIRSRPDSIVYTNVVADSNALHGFYLEMGDYQKLSYATLTNNGEHGLYVEDGWEAPPIEHVTMTGNRIPCRLTFSMLSPKRMLEGDTNVYSPNELNIIEVRGNYPVDTLDYELPFDIKHEGSKSAIPVTTYHIVANSLYVPDGYTLEVDPGVVVKVDEQYRIRVDDGRLEAVGTEGERITFTSHRDDSVGNTAYGQGGDSGDTNDDGASMGAPDDWDGIDVDDAGSIRLEYTDVRFADDNLSMNVDSGLGVVAELRNSTFEEAVDDGIYLVGGTGDTLIMEDCRVSGNLDDGLSLGAVSGEVRNCTISGNLDRGVSATSYLKPTFIDNMIVANGFGLYLYNSAPADLSGNLIAYNQRGVVTGSNNTSLIGGSPSNANSILLNDEYGVDNLDDHPDIIATYNWWGDNSGPYDPSDDTGSGGDYNPGGAGDRVSDDVVYRPWIGSGASGAGRKVTLPAGDGSPVRVLRTGVVIDPESGPGGGVTVLDVPVRPPADSTLVMVGRHWFLMSDDLEDGAFRADVCFYLDPDDVPAGADVDSLLVCMGDVADSSWVALATTVDADSLKFCIDNLAVTGVFGIGALPTTGIPEGPGSPNGQSASSHARLFPASPNPFAGEVTIRFELPVEAPVRIAVYDVAGRLIRVLADRVYGPGGHALTWDGLDARGSAVAPGVYFCLMESQDSRGERKVVLLR